MTIFLVRHATAGIRTSSADDIERPLDANGVSQANEIASRLAIHPITTVYSSPATRCVQTVEPLAFTLGRNVQMHDDLWEGHWDRRGLDLALGLAHRSDGDIVLCSHGDVLPVIIDGLLAQGMTTSGPVGMAKGSIWTLTVHPAGKITHGSYAPTLLPVS